MELNLPQLAQFGIMIEPTGQWQWLVPFYLKKPLAALFLQIDIIITMVIPSFLKQNIGFHQLRERSGTSTLIFSTLLSKAGLIPGKFLEYFIYTITQTCKVIESVIFWVFTAPLTCFKRAMKRNRPYEVVGLTLQYLT